MNVQCVAPLRRAWARMKDILFRPFNLGKWLVIGFSAWLAGLAGGGGGGGFRFNPSHDRVPSLHVRQALRGAWEHLRAHPNWLALIIVAAAVLAVIFLLLLWISSRGKFIFLDNVVHGRARIAEPWRRFAQRGDSLFFWRLGFVIACIVALAAMGTLAVVSAGGFAGFGFGNVRAAAITVLAVLAALVWGVACAYVSLFLDGFVVPVMYKEGIGAVEAWRRLLPWIESHFGSFFLYGLFLLGLAVALGVGVVVAGLLTCCVGLVLIALPYVGTVILLPFLVTYRAFSLEFLAQLDAGFTILPKQPLAPAPPAPTPA